MEQTAVFEEKISVTPRDLHGEISNFEDIILKKLKGNLEGQCSKHGFVVPGSLKLLSRSMGIAEKGRGTADFLYFVKAEGKVYNPPDGFQTKGKVMLKNKMGCYVILEDAIRVMIPRDLHIGNETFDSLEVGDMIRIEIKKSQFRANAKHILSIGQFLGKDEEEEGKAAAVAVGVAPREEGGGAAAPGEAAAVAVGVAPREEGGGAAAPAEAAEEEGDEEEEEEEEEEE